MVSAIPFMGWQSEVGPRRQFLDTARRLSVPAFCGTVPTQRPAVVPTRGLLVPLLISKRRNRFPTCSAASEPFAAQKNTLKDEEQDPASKEKELSEFRKKRLRRKIESKREQLTYQIAAVGATFLVGSMAVCATYSRFFFLRDGGEIPFGEFAATLLLVCGGVVGMEMYARWAHKALWHDFEPAWKLHKSHHEPRTGPFEANDIYAVVNAVPAMALCWHGFFHQDVLGGICWGTGLGITLFGMMYMFVHDGLVHKRFPVGPIAQVPYLKRVAAAHKLHHIADFDGVPWGLFLAEQELEGIPGAIEQLDKLVAMEEKSEKH